MVHVVFFCSKQTIHARWVDLAVQGRGTSESHSITSAMSSFQSHRK